MKTMTSTVLKKMIEGCKWKSQRKLETTPRNKTNKLIHNSLKQASKERHWLVPNMTLSNTRRENKSRVTIGNVWTCPRS